MIVGSLRNSPIRMIICFGGVFFLWKVWNCQIKVLSLLKRNQNINYNE